MVYKELTQDQFQDLKGDFPVYGTSAQKDKYRNEYTVRDEQPKCTVHTMWQPLTDYYSVAEYGKAVSKMFYGIIYEDADIDYNDVIIIRDSEYEVMGIKYFNTYTRLEVKKKEG